MKTEIFWNQAIELVDLSKYIPFDDSEEITIFDMFHQIRMN